jgi:hypothetical protein
VSRGRKKRRRTRRRRPFGLPLLIRELSDQAGRLRHYVLRTAVATFLSLLGFLYFWDVLADQGPASLGTGPILFEGIVGVEACCILIFVPAMTCGAIAGEKERNTLAVLLTTRLSPATIVLEKLLSRLVLVFSPLLLSLPLLAFAYALGGLSVDHMIAAIVWLLAISVLLATLSLMCSAWCSSTVSAFFMTYVVGIAFCVAVFGGPLRTYVALYVRGGNLPGPWILLSGVLLPTVVFFLVTVRCLVRRASVAPQNFILWLFRRLDAIFNRMNVLTGNIVLTRPTAALPGDKPIAWRETAKKSLGTARYLVRVLVAIELPTVCLLYLGAKTNRVTGASVGSSLWLIDWCVAAALISVRGGSLVSRERQRQTLPALLATPIPGDQIVTQLFSGVRRLIFVLCVPFATIAGFDYWFHLFATIWMTPEWLFCAALELAIYPFLIGWVTFYLGARIRSPLWAIMASLMVVAGTFVLPFLALSIESPFGYWSFWRQGDLPLYFLLASPSSIIVANEFGKASLPYTCVNFAVYGGLLFGIRRLCLRRADRLLGRVERQAVQPMPAVPVRQAERIATA